MKKHIELFRSTVGSIVVPASLLDPTLRQSHVRGAAVVGIAIMFGALLVSVTIAHKNYTVVRDLFARLTVRA